MSVTATQASKPVVQGPQKQNALKTPTTLQSKASKPIVAAPQSDSAIMGLAQQILQRQIVPQNNEIRYRCKGFFFNHNYNVSFPSNKTVSVGTAITIAGLTAIACKSIISIIASTSLMTLPILLPTALILLVE